MKIDPISHPSQKSAADGSMTLTVINEEVGNSSEFIGTGSTFGLETQYLRH